MSKKLYMAFVGFVLHSLVYANPHHMTAMDSLSTGPFAQPIADLSPDEHQEFTLGNRIFNTHWLIAPASDKRFDGLGPLFNSLSCAGCHFNNGRGRPPIEGEKMLSSMLVRLSVPGTEADGGPKPHPHYGGQLNDKAIPGVLFEGHVKISYQEMPGVYPDGTPYSLRMPTYSIEKLNYGLLDGVLTSPRVAPTVIGLGFLEAIPDEALLANQDIDDSNQDGISGKANWILNTHTQKKMLGRFGWKANQPSIKSQDAGAMLGDIGITSSVNPVENCTDAQTACKNAKKGDTLDLSDKDLAALTFYTQTLAVPPQRASEHSEQGQKIFQFIGCNHCHIPHFKTGTHPLKSLHEQDIYPYTDLLLHDMGEGLADGRPDYEASASEWRTPPLWGIGLIPEISKHNFLLHDGRARNIEEAILWHGGEGQKSKEAFMSLSREERHSLLQFLKEL